MVCQVTHTCDARHVTEPYSFLLGTQALIQLIAGASDGLFEGSSQPKICKIQLWFCFPLSLASLLHLQVQCVYDQAVKTATKQNDTLRSDQQLSGIYFFQAIILNFKLEQGAQHGHFIDWIREKLSWLICMMTLLSCVCSYDRNKRVFIGLLEHREKRGEKRQRRAEQVLCLVPLCSVSPARALFFFATLSAQLIAVLAAAAFPNATNRVSKETGISCSPSLVDAHITLVHHPDKNICDFKKSQQKPFGGEYPL